MDSFLEKNNVGLRHMFTIIHYDENFMITSYLVPKP